LLKRILAKKSNSVKGKTQIFTASLHILKQRCMGGMNMNKFASGMGMGMVAGACVGLALMGMMTDAEKRRMKRSAVRTIRKAEDLASGMGLMK
jgi:hypothetical protein